MLPTLSPIPLSFPFSLAGNFFQVQLVFLVHPTSRLLVRFLNLSMGDHEFSLTVSFVSLPCSQGKMDVKLVMDGVRSIWTGGQGAVQAAGHPAARIASTTPVVVASGASMTRQPPTPPTVGRHLVTVTKPTHPRKRRPNPPKRTQPVRPRPDVCHHHHATTPLANIPGRGGNPRSKPPLARAAGGQSSRRL